MHAQQNQTHRNSHGNGGRIDLRGGSSFRTRSGHNKPSLRTGICRHFGPRFLGYVASSIRTMSRQFIRFGIQVRSPKKCSRRIFAIGWQSANGEGIRAPGSRRGLEGQPGCFSTLACMERICSHCRAVLDKDNQADWCPACGGALTERPAFTEPNTPGAPPPEIDHRGIVLPRRHALGGIITPQ